jgi:hypothetical protein
VTGDANGLAARVKALSASERSYALYWLAHDPDSDEGVILERALDAVDRAQASRELVDRELQHDPLASYHSPFTAASAAEVAQGVAPERTATPAEHADTAARIERAREAAEINAAAGWDSSACAECGSREGTVVDGFHEECRKYRDALAAEQTAHDIGGDR